MAQGSILIVEDEKDVQDVLAEIVTLFGYDVSLMSDGAEAWAMIQRESFDLIITDLGLPGMDGSELLRNMRAHGIATPVLVVAGVDFDRSDLDIKNISDCAFVQKPFKINDMGSKINDLIGKVTAGDNNSIITPTQ